MGRALVIKGVSFALNKLTTVEFTEAIPCTGIELNESSVSLSSVGETETLVPTLTPANTTDTVSWASSDTNIVTVNNGTITAVGIGTATITATCGTQTAACSVQVTNVLSFEYSIGNYNHKSEVTAEDYVYYENGTAAYCAIYSITETEKRIRKSGGGNVYPILLGDNAETVTVSVPNYIRVTAWFTNSEQACDYSIDHPTFDYLAKLISGDASAYDGTVPVGNRTLTVPSGADSIALSLQYPGGGTLTEEILAQVSIVAS